MKTNTECTFTMWQTEQILSDDHLCIPEVETSTEMDLDLVWKTTVM